MWYTKDFGDGSWAAPQDDLKAGLVNGSVPINTIMLSGSLRSDDDRIFIRTDSPTVLALMGSGFAPIGVAQLPFKPVILISDSSYP